MADRARLTDTLALAAQPREREYAVHDTALQGFILRVQPNGARSWVFRFRRDGKPRRVTLGEPGAVKADRARAAALAFLAREKGGGTAPSPPPSGPTLKTFAAEYVERRSPSLKPSTVKATLCYLNSATLPALGRAGATGQPRRNGVRGVGVPRQERERTAGQERPLLVLDQGPRCGGDRGGCAAA